METRFGRIKGNRGIYFLSSDVPRRVVRNRLSCFPLFAISLSGYPFRLAMLRANTRQAERRWDPARESAVSRCLK